MFIAHFNRYFEKHARITYIVLLLIIIATFVIFVTPGDVLRGEKRVSDFGSIYGKKLTVERVEKEMSRTTVGCWFQYPQIFGQSLSSNKDMLFGEMLNRIRLLHYAKEKGLNNVSDDEVRNVIATFEPFKKDGSFSQEYFQNFLDYIKRSFDIMPAEFDDILRDNIAIERVNKSVKDAVTVADAEIDAELARFVLKGATISLDAADAQPAEEELQAFFASRKAELKLPATKNAMVALFKFDELAKALADDVSITPSLEEIKDYFDRNADRLYKGKTLAESTAAIKAALSLEKVRSEARRRVGKLYDEFVKRTEGEDNAARIQRFRAAAETAGAVCQSSGLVSTENVISGMNGAQPNLAAVIRDAGEVGDVTRMAIGAGYAAIACITEKTATPLPDALPERAADAKGLDSLRQLIADTLVAERAKAFFEEKIRKPFDAYTAVVKLTQEDKTLNDNAKWARINEAATAIDNNLVVPFYIEETRDFGLVTFAPDSYAEKVQVPTDEDVAKAYEDAKDEYTKVSVRLSKMVFATEGLEGEALAACLKQAGEALAAVKNGGDFQEIAKQFTADKKSVDDYVAVDIASLSPAIKTAVENLKAGEISGIVEDGASRVIVKVLERQDVRTLAEVKDELKQELLEAAMRRMADNDAAALSAALDEAWWKAVAENEAQTDAAELDGVALLKKLAAEYPEADFALCEQVSPFDRGSQDAQLLNKIFTATLKVPLTANVVGQNASYVACLSKITEGHLGDPDKDEQYAAVLKRVYGEKVQKEAALKRAEDEKARVAAALAANGGKLEEAAGTLVFRDLPEFSMDDINNGAQIVQDVNRDWNFNLSALLPELEKAAAGTMLNVQLAERSFALSSANPYARTVLPFGYQLLYVAERKAPEASDELAKSRENVRARLLSQKQQKALNDLMTELEAQSDTRIRPETSFAR